MEKKKVKEILEQTLKLSPEKARTFLIEKFGQDRKLREALLKMFQEDEKLNELMGKVGEHIMKGFSADCSKCRKCQ